ncbi:MAG: hypothetical protein AAF570_26970, partial [Bacteroidota bacterium]
MKPRPTNLTAGLLLLAFNPLTAWLLLSEVGFLKMRGLSICLALAFAALLGLTLRKTAGFAELWRRSGWFNGLLLLGGLAVILCTNRLYAGQFKWFRVLAYAALFLQMLRTLHMVVVRPKRAGWKARLLTTGAGLLGIFLILEAVFTFVGRSHGSNPAAYAHLIWQHRHWGLLNADGYREREFGSMKGKRRVWVIGDSFTAGAGIQDRSKRFTEVAEQRLGSEVAVLNLGQPGSDTQTELR